MNIKKISILLIFILLIASGFSCTKSKSQQLKPVEINVWGVYENTENLKPLFDAYNKAHPTVTVKYRKFRYNEYEKQLLEAWAEDRGPDIYFLPNNWVGKYKNKITPLPSKLKLPFREIKVSGIGSFTKTDIIDSIKEVKATSLNDLITNYPEVIYKDLVKENEIYGLPLSLETMGLFYNKDMMYNANIPFPPKTWIEFNEMVKDTTLLDEENNFKQSGTALGTTDNITNAADLLITLIEQNGVQLINNSNKINFGNITKAMQAINFYNDFSNPIKEVYCWNENQNDALESFISGQVAFFFGYPHHVEQIEKGSGKLNFGITQIPQIKDTNNPINFANYWVMTVSHKSDNKDIAWGFINFAVKEENAKIYLEAAHKPTALKSLIEEQSNDLELQPFADQILTAKSWYRGRSPQEAEDALIELSKKLKENIYNQKDLEDLFNYTARKINQTID